jgi:hypothetical protein
VVQRAVHAAAVRRAEHHRQAEVAVRPVTHPRDLRDDLVERGMDEVGELDLGDRDERAAPSDRDADDAGFRPEACR